MIRKLLATAALTLLPLSTCAASAMAGDTPAAAPATEPCNAPLDVSNVAACCPDGSDAHECPPALARTGASVVLPTVTAVLLVSLGTVAIVGGVRLRKRAGHR